MGSRGLRFTEAAPIFAALGDETRLQLLARLGHHGPQSITELTRDSRLTRQAVTKHLLALERAGLLTSERDGRERHWTLRRERLSEVQSCLDRISIQWDAAVERLRKHVED